MPDPFDLARLELADDSEFLRLLREHADIEALRYRDGEYLMREGEDSQEVFLVLKGAFVVERASLRPDLPPVILATVLCDPEQPGIVGEMAYFDTQLRSASVRSSGGSFVLRLKPAHIDAVIASFPGLTRAICAQFSSRLREMNKTLGGFQAKFALNSVQRMANPEEVLFRKGEPAQTLFQLATGSVRLEREGQVKVVQADQLVQGFLEPGAFFRKGLHTCSATVESHAFVVAIDRTQMQAVVRGYPELVMSLF
ncbi:MAG: cyclic nucleotide-binding domain-containing protein [Holophaga sp.]|nr:cyclic nucleotide-binding domain-containing protein [Holophaga sp.]